MLSHISGHAVNRGLSLAQGWVPEPTGPADPTWSPAHKPNGNDFVSAWVSRTGPGVSHIVPRVLSDSFTSGKLPPPHRLWHRGRKGKEKQDPQAGQHECLSPARKRTLHLIFIVEGGRGLLSIAILVGGLGILSRAGRVQSFISLARLTTSSEPLLILFTQVAR